MKLSRSVFIIFLLSVVLAKGQGMDRPGEVSCTDFGCLGKYSGPEFVNGSDIAHQLSNTISKEVGQQLKALFHQGKYRKVDFSSIQMSTQGMGSGTVVYQLKIPFVAVPTACDAFTSFDHVGGWNHTPALNQRKQQLNDVTLPGEQLYVSKLKRTPEGLQEYWIQWRNSQVQNKCASIRD
ncbi:hypothetical protein [Nonlabens xiamenensis]|uniref:hypothetical protein n=1 Tax=Nonlabens xiamenensis TaxID=2341043 RepID=UPI000F607E90|nr:hypothetical protein [Nonlabens xiamenensis]